MKNANPQNPKAAKSVSSQDSSFDIHKHLKKYTLVFTDKNTEKDFIQEKLSSSKCLINIFIFFQLILTVCNLTLFLLKINDFTPEANTSTSSTKTSNFLLINVFSLSLLSIGVIISLFIIKNHLTNSILLHFQCFLYSLNIFQILFSIKILQENKDDQGLLVTLTLSNPINLLIFFICYDLMFQLVWVNTRINSFIMNSCSNVLKIGLYVFYCYFNKFFDVEFSILASCFYGIIIMEIIFISRKFEIIEKTNFLYKINGVVGRNANGNTNGNKTNNTQILTQNNISQNVMNNFVESINSGYINLKLLTPKNNINSGNGGSGSATGSAKNFILKTKNKFFKENSKFFLKDEDSKNFINTNYLSQEKQELMLELIFSGISNKEKFLENFQKNEILQKIEKFVESPNPNHESKQVQIELEVSKSDKKLLDDISGYNYVSNLNLNQNQNSLSLLKNNKNNFNKNFDQFLFLNSICNYIKKNKTNFSTFSHLGKATLLTQHTEILSLEIFAKFSSTGNTSSPIEEIEFIFNDITKEELKKNFTQFLLRTSQYLHDFKNPLICIQNEVSELKEECEFLLSLLCKHNEDLDNNHNNIARVEVDEEDCLNLLDKFEYTKKMSEYCQMMIGTYEDLSKSLLNPNSSVKLVIENFDLISLLNFIEDMMNFQISNLKKNVEFFLKQEINMSFTEDNVISINTDQTKLKRVLINLLSNSLKFTQNGSITLIVTKEIINKKNYYKFSINDTGAGMSKAEMEKLFTPFNSNNENGNKNGVGLGLVIVKELTEKMGIGVKVNSVQGSGTSISFLIEDKEGVEGSINISNNYGNDYYGKKKSTKSFTRTNKEEKNINDLFNNIEIKEQVKDIDNTNEPYFNKILKTDSGNLNVDILSIGGNSNSDKPLIAIDRATTRERITTKERNASKERTATKERNTSKDKNKNKYINIVDISNENNYADQDNDNSMTYFTAENKVSLNDTQEINTRVFRLPPNLTNLIDVNDLTNDVITNVNTFKFNIGSSGTKGGLKDDNPTLTYSLSLIKSLNVSNLSNDGENNNGINNIANRLNSRNGTKKDFAFIMEESDNDNITSKDNDGEKGFSIEKALIEDEIKSMNKSMNKSINKSNITYNTNIEGVAGGGTNTTYNKDDKTNEKLKTNMTNDAKVITNIENDFTTVDKTINDKIITSNDRMLTNNSNINNIQNFNTPYAAPDPDANLMLMDNNHSGGAGGFNNLNASSGGFVTPTHSDNNTHIATNTYKNTFTGGAFINTTPTGGVNLLAMPTGNPTLFASPTGGANLLPTPTGNPVVSLFVTPTGNPGVTPGVTPRVNLNNSPSGGAFINSTPTGGINLLPTPTGNPGASLLVSPTGNPTGNPGANILVTPSGNLTVSPSGNPGLTPSGNFTVSPSGNPGLTPSGNFTVSPSGDPSVTNNKIEENILLKKKTTNPGGIINSTNTKIDLNTLNINPTNNNNTNIVNLNPTTDISPLTRNPTKKETSKSPSSKREKKGIKSKYLSKNNMVNLNVNINTTTNINSSKKLLAIYKFLNLNPINEINFTLTAIESKNYLNTPKLRFQNNFSKKNSSQFVNFISSKTVAFNNVVTNKLRPMISLESKATNKMTMKVLIIDDDKPIRSFCKNLFKKVEEKNNLLNFDIEEAEDGSTGLIKILEKISKNEKGFDIILTDDNMTYLDGSNMLHILLFMIENKLIKLEAGENIFNKFVICSSDVENVRKVVPFERHENLVICEKPLNMSTIKTLINF
jgi:signal transduction histidine kinase